MQHFGIIGGGAWGTALAQVLRRAGRDVVLWAHERETVDAINRDHVNQLFLPGIALDRGIVATTELPDALRADVLLLAPPAQHLRTICAALAPRWQASGPIVVCTKGIEEASGALMSEVVASILPRAALAILSGPTFAAEVARGLPTAVTLAAAEPIGRPPHRRYGERANSARTCRTTSRGRGSAARSRTCSRSPAASSWGAVSATMRAPTRRPRAGRDRASRARQGRQGGDFDRVVGPR